MVGNVELLSTASPVGLMMTATVDWHLFFPNTALMKSCGHRAIPIALRPPFSMKLADSLHYCIIARAGQAEVSVLEPLTW